MTTEHKPHAVSVNYFDSSSTATFAALPEALRYYADMIEHVYQIEDTVCSITLKSSGEIKHVYRPE